MKKPKAIITLNVLFTLNEKYLWGQEKFKMLCHLFSLGLYTRGKECDRIYAHLLPPCQKFPWRINTRTGPGTPKLSPTFKAQVSVHFIFWWERTQKKGINLWRPQPIREVFSFYFRAFRRGHWLRYHDFKPPFTDSNFNFTRFLLLSIGYRIFLFFYNGISGYYTNF